MQMLSRIVASDSANRCSPISSTYVGMSRLLGQTLTQGAVTAYRYRPSAAFLPLASGLGKGLREST